MELPAHQKVGQARQWLELAFDQVVQKRRSTDSMSYADKLDQQLDDIQSSILKLHRLEAELAIDDVSAQNLAIVKSA